MQCGGEICALGSVALVFVFYRFISLLCLGWFGITGIMGLLLQTLMLFQWGDFRNLYGFAFNGFGISFGGLEWKPLSAITIVSTLSRRCSVASRGLIDAWLSLLLGNLNFAQRKFCTTIGSIHHQCWKFSHYRTAACAAFPIECLEVVVVRTIIGVPLL